METEKMGTERTKAFEKISKPARANRPSPKSQAHRPQQQMQDIMGNKAVSRLIQCALPVSKPDDPLEREADRAAEALIQQDSSAPVVHPVPHSDTESQRRSEMPSTESVSIPISRGGLSRSRSKSISTGDRHGHQGLTSGHILPENIRFSMEPRFGVDLGSVKIHTDGDAAGMSQELGAQAFTAGPNIYFDAGRYQPETSKGLRLLAHELTHVAQQTGYNHGQPESFIQRYCDSPETCLEDLDEVNRNLVAAVVSALFLNIMEESGESNFAQILLVAALEILPESLEADLEIRSRDVAAISEIRDDEYEYTIPTALRVLNILHTQAETSLELELERPSYGLEHVIQIMASHIASYFIGVLEPSYETHRVHAERVETALENLREDLSIILVAINTPRNLMQLELEGALNQLIELRLNFESMTDRTQRSIIGREIGTVARTALQLNHALAELHPGPSEVSGTELDELLVEAAVEIAQIRELQERGEEVSAEDEQFGIEEQTISELDEGLELLAVTPIGAQLVDRLFIPFFPEFLAPHVDETTGRFRMDIEPEWAFPRLQDQLSNQFMEQLGRRVSEQRTELETLRNQIIPDSYEIPDFAAVFRRWFAFFSLAQERQDPTVHLILDIMNDAYQPAGADIYSGLGFAGAISQGSSALFRAQLLQDYAGLLESVLRSATAQFAEEITQADLLPQEAIVGGALNPEFLFAQLYMATNPEGECVSEQSCREAEQTSRQALREQQHRQTAQPFVSAAEVVSRREQERAQRTEREARSIRGRLTPRLPGSEQRERVENRERVARMAGAIIQNQEGAPIYGLLENLRNPQARVGWHYLIDVYTPLGERVAHEHRIMPPEVSDYLLAFRQHAETLRQRHRPMAPGPTRRPIGERAIREGRLISPAPNEERQASGIESGEAANVARYLLGEQRPQPSRTAVSLTHTLREARESAGILRTSDPTEQAAWALISAMERYFDEFYAVHPESSYRLASIFVLADIQFGVGRELMQLRNPETILEMAREAIRITLTLRTLNSLGPVGMLAAQGYRAYLGMQGTSEIAALASIASFMRGASRANSFNAARAWSYMAPYIVDDVRELMESIVGSPARHATNLSFDIITGRQPRSPQDLAEWCRPLMGNPESREALLEGVNARITNLEVEDAGASRSIPEYNAMIVFRDQLLQQTSVEQMELNVDPDMLLPGRTEVRSEIETTVPPTGRIQEQRAELLSALGDLQGRVIWNPDPDLGSTVIVHYRPGARVWIEVGPEANARQMRPHVELARQLMRYEGVFGRIWRLMQDVRRLLRGEPLTMSRGYRAELEVDKLTSMLDDLLEMREQIERRAEQLIEHPERAAAERDEISREIESLSRQLRRHMLELGSTERVDSLEVAALYGLQPIRELREEGERGARSVELSPEARSNLREHIEAHVSHLNDVLFWAEDLRQMINLEGPDYRSWIAQPFVRWEATDSDLAQSQAELIGSMARSTEALDEISRIIDSEEVQRYLEDYNRTGRFWQPDDNIIRCAVALRQLGLAEELRTDIEELTEPDESSFRRWITHGSRRIAETSQRFMQLFSGDEFDESTPYTQEITSHAVSQEGEAFNFEHVERVQQVLQSQEAPFLPTQRDSDYPFENPIPPDLEHASEPEHCPEDRFGNRWLYDREANLWRVDLTPDGLNYFRDRFRRLSDPEISWTIGFTREGQDILREFREGSRTEFPQGVRTAYIIIDEDGNLVPTYIWH